MSESENKEKKSGKDKSIKISIPEVVFKVILSFITYHSAMHLLFE